MRQPLGLARSYQITQFCPEYTSVENVMLAAMSRVGGSYGAWTPLLDDAALGRRAREVVERIGLGPLADVPARDIGHGEHRQLELAMALALEPKSCCSTSRWRG